MRTEEEGTGGEDGSPRDDGSHDGALHGKPFHSGLFCFPGPHTPKTSAGKGAAKHHRRPPERGRDAVTPP
ncbi:hypothetical protein GCM10022630_44230 [Thermobifida alba]